MEYLVAFGAPERILMMSKPHLGTDRLVVILRAFRERLIQLGVEVRGPYPFARGRPGEGFHCHAHSSVSTYLSIGEGCHCHAHSSVSTYQPLP